jgi:PAS domain-containing protein
LDEETSSTSLAPADVQALVDTFSESTTDEGLAIHVGILLPSDVAAPSETLLAEWGTVLATRTTQSALTTSQKRIRELAERLEDTQRQGVDLEQELSQVRSLNETLELLALVASKTDNAVIILDAAGLIEWVNDGFVRITGLELPDVRDGSMQEENLSAIGGLNDSIPFA